MPSVRVGQTEIPYELRRTGTISERRITVTPGCVEVLALTTDDDAAIEGFIDRKRQWLFDTVRELEEVTANRPAVPRFMSGSKIPYRERQSALTVRRHDGSHVEIAHRTGFVVDLPSWVKAEAAETVVATEIKLWLRRRVRRDVHEIAGAYGARFGLKPRALRVAEFATGWGSCGPSDHPDRLAARLHAQARAGVRRRPRGRAPLAPLPRCRVLGVPGRDAAGLRAGEGLAGYAPGKPRRSVLSRPHPPAVAWRASAQRCEMRAPGQT
jgi:hypothetical protein